MSLEGSRFNWFSSKENGINAKRKVRESGGFGGKNTNDSMESAAFVTLRFAMTIFRFTGAELAKVLCGFGNCVREQLHFYSA